MFWPFFFDLLSFARMPPSLLARLTRGLPPMDAARLNYIHEYAREHLQRLSRRSGESYALHGLEVAVTLRELGEDASLLAVALLNDLLEHPDGERLLKASPLKSPERELVRRMKSLRRLHIDSSSKDLDAVIAAFTGEPRLLPLRMAHRLNDIRHFDRFPKHIRKLLASETLHMYGAIAGRLGLHAWRVEMEEACFPVAHPAQAKALRDQFDAHRQADDACLRQARDFALKALKERGIRAHVSTRRKSLYSTFRKMVFKHRSFEEVADRLALRIIVKDVDDCYRSLGVIHGRMRPMPGKLKDYIGAPKENGYRSIHTVVFPLPGVTEQPVEIQIRTEAMHVECEYGLANHQGYKEYVYALTAQPARVSLFQNLTHLRASARSPQKFEEALRTYFREDRLIVFDAEGSMYHIPKPSTAMDFIKIIAPNRHPFVKTIRINGRRSAPDMPLHDGDTIEAKFGSRKKS